MLIKDMTREASISLLKGSHVGRIACARGSQPYITPMSFAYHDTSIYSFSTVGQKIEWMRVNPLVCVEVDKIVNHREWETVVVFGRYEELTKTPEFYEARGVAHDLLATTANWWEPGYVKTLRGRSERSFETVYFRIAIDEISGHQAFPAMEA